jgi:hypothetical protein
MILESSAVCAASVTLVCTASRARGRGDGGAASNRAD